LIRQRLFGSSLFCHKIVPISNTSWTDSLFSLPAHGLCQLPTSSCSHYITDCGL
ncbi:hypothetical protein J6590_106374, partial [Homalodisca vitripennis]